VKKAGVKKAGVKKAGVKKAQAKVSPPTKRAGKAVARRGLSH
jgi:hypothetical protein